jgi:hypothetical protein
MQSTPSGIMIDSGKKNITYRDKEEKAEEEEDHHRK